MEIALIGYGKMGKAIEPLLQSRGHRLHSVYDSHRRLNADALAGADAAIEFTRPELAIQHIRICAQAGCPIITGTTGWHAHRDTAFEIVKEYNGALFYASNFSPGVNIAFHLTEILTAILKKFPEYKPVIEEIHHTQKLDAPSGTAITFAEKIIEQNPFYRRWVLSDHCQVNEIPIKSIRQGEVAGTHHIRFTSENDQIEISHLAFNRHGFALGAITAAEFLHGKHGVYTMSDLLNDENYSITH